MAEKNCSAHGQEAKEGRGLTSPLKRYNQQPKVLSENPTSSQECHSGMIQAFGGHSISSL
jgi:hypothetical protein